MSDDRHICGKDAEAGPKVPISRWVVDRPYEYRPDRHGPWPVWQPPDGELPPTWTPPIVDMIRSGDLEAVARAWRRPSHCRSRT